MNKLLTFIAILGVLNFISCNDSDQQQQLSDALTELENQKEENQILLSQMSKKKDYKNHLIHYVFLDVKNDISDKQYAFLIAEIKNLAKIPGVQDFEVGRFENMDDDRAMESRDINFEMRFEKKMDYYNYQKSKEHIKVRELLSPFLARAPLTYDYLIQ